MVKGRYQGLSVGTNVNMLRQIVSGVEHLHDQKIIHRDLKPINILISLPLDESNRISGRIIRPLMKLADFGISRIIQEDGSHLNRTVTRDGYSVGLRLFGTDGWIAPEILNGEFTYTDKIDIFPLGLIFGFILNGGLHPFEVPPEANDREETREETHKRTSNRNERMMKKLPMILKVEQLKAEDRIVFELIKRMLSTDPKARPTAAQVLAHDFFRRDSQVYILKSILNLSYWKFICYFLPSRKKPN